MNLLKKWHINYKIYFLRKRLKDLNRKWNIVLNVSENICNIKSEVVVMPYSKVRKFQDFAWAVKLNKIKTKSELFKLKDELKNG